MSSFVKVSAILTFFSNRLLTFPLFSVNSGFGSGSPGFACGLPRWEVMSPFKNDSSVALSQAS